MGKLYFNTDCLNLIESLQVPASIIINNSEFSRNRAAESGNTGNMDTVISRLESQGGFDEEYIIRICGNAIRSGIIRDNVSEFIVFGISFKNTPGYLVLTGCGTAGLSSGELIKRFNSLEGIRKVLLVDDNPAIIETYQSMLELLGHETFRFTDPVAALSSMSGTSFDLLISDYDMPGMNGLELTGKFRIHRPGLPVIIISGSAAFTGGNPVHAHGRSPLTFLNKPVTFYDLRRSIEVMEFFYIMDRLVRA